MNLLFDRCVTVTFECSDSFYFYIYFMINNGIHFASVFDFGIVPTLWYFILLFHFTQ